MKMDSAISNALAKRRDRSIAVILSLKERECDQYLPKEVQAKLRKTVLDQINNFHEICIDLLGAIPQDEQVILNEYYLTKITELHDHIVGTNGDG